MAVDFLGDEMPVGYKAWSCDVCTAVCNYEAMTLCNYRGLTPCGFEKDQPESNGGLFGFMVKDN